MNASAAQQHPATIRILFPARHLLDGAGAVAVLRQEVDAVRAARFRPSLVILAPRLVPRSQRSAARETALRDAVAAVGVPIDAILGTDFGPKAWPALMRTAYRMVGRRPFGPESDLDLDRLTAPPAGADHAGPQVGGVLCNYMSGLRAADALARRDRQLILLHDLPAADPPAGYRAALSGRPNLISLSHVEADRLAALLPGATVHVGVPIADRGPDRGDKAGSCGETVPPSEAVDGPAAGTDLLFVGGMHPPNLEGITRFIEGCFMPYLAPTGCTLSVGGRVCDALARFHGVPGLRLLGRVDDLRPMYRSARLVIVPLLTGTGVSLKTLEALDAGCTVLSTPAGLRGVASVGALAPPFDRRWAGAIERLLSRPAESKALRRDMVATVHGPTLGETLAHVLPALVEGRHVQSLPRRPLFAKCAGPFENAS